MSVEIRVLALPESVVPPALAGHSVVRTAAIATQTEIDLRNQGNQLVTGQLDAMLFVSAWALDVFVDTCSRTSDRQRLLNAMIDSTMIAASHSVRRRFRELGVEPSIELAEQQSWRDILVGLDRLHRLEHCQIALEDVLDASQLSAGLEARGARVSRIVPARFEPTWSDDERRLMDAWLAGRRDAVAVVGAAMLPRLRQLMQASEMREGADGLLAVLVPESLRDVAAQYGWHKVVTFEADVPLDWEAVRCRLQRVARPATMVIRPDDDAPRPAWFDSPFMRAVRREPTPVTPVWLMRQAGRYMQEYRDVRAQVSFLDLCRDPQLCSEVMCTAVDRLGVDAAIIFSDLLPMLIPMGMELEYQKGDGPVIHNPLRTPEDVRRVRRLTDLSEVGFVFETVQQTRRDLPDAIPLIGFAGAPFTLASYMIEGRGSRHYAHTKQLMFSHPEAWAELMDVLTDSIATYLVEQLSCGAQCVQIFDSWAGCLAADDYRQRVLPWMVRLIDRVASHGHVINFATGNPELLPMLAQTRADVVGVDWRIDLATAWQRVGYDRAVQGNLDPTVLLTDPTTIRQRVRRILDDAGQRPGHIFNLGHGVLPQTPVAHARAVVDYVHELSRR